MNDATSCGSDAWVADADLDRLLDESRRVRQILSVFPARNPRVVLEQMAIEGAISGEFIQKNALSVENLDI